MSILSAIYSVFKRVLKYSELLFFCCAILLLYFIPLDGDSFSFCVFKLAGFTDCPGCGLGHAIQLALHFQFTLSFQAHWFGMPAVVIIVYRIVQLITHLNLPKHEPKPCVTNSRYRTG
jgi:hypothetical protein